MDFWPLSIGLRGCPVTLVRNHHYSLRINPEERSSHLLRSGSLKSRICLHLSGDFMEAWSASCCPWYVCIEVIEVLGMRVFVFSFPGIPLSLCLFVCVLYAFWHYVFGDKNSVFRSLVCVKFNSAAFVFILWRLLIICTRFGDVVTACLLKNEQMRPQCIWVVFAAFSWLKILLHFLTVWPTYKTVAEPCCTWLVQSGDIGLHRTIKIK